MSNYNTYIGSKKALQFPVMCDGYIELSYSDNIATTPYGIWNHEGDFTLETLITPYDINGFGDRRQKSAGIATHTNGIVTSQKTMPASDYYSLHTGIVRQDELYLPLKFRGGYDNDYNNTGSAHKMMLFKSLNMELYLENTTTHNFNQPAEYKIVFKLKITNTHTLESTAAIRARSGNFNLNDTTVQYKDSVQNLKVVDNVTGSVYVSGSKILHIYTTAANFHKGMKLYDSSGYYIGIVTAITGGSDVSVDTTDTDYSFELKGCSGSSYSFTVTHPTDTRVKEDMIVDNLGDNSIVGTQVNTVTDNENFEIDVRHIFSFSNVTLKFTGYTSHTILPDGKVYTLPDKEPIYSEGLYHIAIAFDDATGKMVITLNGSEVAEGTHIDRTNSIFTMFKFGESDMYIGQDASLPGGFVGSVKRKTQFMGEIHELAITKQYNTSYSSLYTLLPQYRNLMFYLNFEEPV